MILKIYTLLLQFLLLEFLILVCNPNAILCSLRYLYFLCPFFYSPQDKFLDTERHLERK